MDSLSSTFAALADPTRRAILARLALGETTVNELAEPFEMSLPAVSRHLKVLEHAGLISRSRDAQWRPCKLRGEELKTATEWLEGYRRFWDESFSKLDEYLVRLKASRVEGSGPRTQGSGVKAKATTAAKSRSLRDDKQKGKSKDKGKDKSRSRSSRFAEG